MVVGWLAGDDRAVVNGLWWLLLMIVDNGGRWWWLQPVVTRGVHLDELNFLGGGFFKIN